jgi:2-polyprenyl-6-methoxyphenol hydroxylase-like FAD-dependent oxidoreductase
MAGGRGAAPAGLGSATFADAPILPRPLVPAEFDEELTVTEHTTCVVVGGGPAGIVLGLLLARAGVEVTVLEKHGDFLRDFRGDTVHPSTLQLLDELGLGERFATLPHSRAYEITVPLDEHRDVVVGDLRRLKVPHPYIALVPRWDLLNVLAEAAQQEPTFTLRMRTEATELIRESGRVRGVRYRTRTGPPASCTPT